MHGLISSVVSIRADEGRKIINLLVAAIGKSQQKRDQLRGCCSFIIFGSSPELLSAFRTAPPGGEVRRTDGADRANYPNWGDAVAR
jgi:hypothetical protein